ncbi:ECF transporter S component [Salinibacterium sp. NSLL150]|uniref:ECF transporter S component n=1 Tax=unclassified Salinibacterium TaxID=2632331 RepID=UPI0018CEF05C|nr:MULTISPECIES: ECF transporter S component [unclassified Salinibacterium]MBH0098735.1 ECF transporter S component [Salinibacterium sp. NSLL35]MBH0101490.1 ECF transporter S component [Salinibacterium sp. NSLL150]MBH0104249.1 ECF transporter S component [Salinibacterium sp. NSLL16]MBH0107010.1 ECF transporter S component [Salinibacterium sp. NSLL17]
MTTTAPSSSTSTPTKPGSRFQWRVIDIVVASVIGVASGLIFVVWNIASVPALAPFAALLPGLQAIGGGFWLFAGVLTALVIRKPGAAIYGEMVAASVSALIGNQWGVLTLVSGFTQGIGAEIVFAAFLYANWRVSGAILAGAGAGLAMAITDLLLWYPGSALPFIIIYTIAAIVGGMLIAGLLSWLATRGIAATGALNRFGAGREIAKRV